MSDLEPTEVKADAADRSWRTLLQGLAVDLAVTIVVVLAMFVADIRWTPEYWAGLGLYMAKSVIQAGVAYLMRMFVAPRRPA